MQIRQALNILADEKKMPLRCFNRTAKSISPKQQLRSAAVRKPPDASGKRSVAFSIAPEIDCTERSTIPWYECLQIVGPGTWRKRFLVRSRDNIKMEVEAVGCGSRKRSLWFRKRRGEPLSAC